MTERIFRCINYSYFYHECFLMTAKGVLINKEDLIPLCDGFKNESLCCWYKDIELTEFM